MADSETGPGGHVAGIPDAPALKKRFERFLTGQGGAPATVTDMRQFPAGFSWITYGCRVERDDRSSELILRLGPPNGLFAPYSAAPQFLALEALAGSGVPVPGVESWSDDPSILGAPFFVSEKVAGSTPEPWGSGVGGDTAWRETVATDFVEAIAGLHRFDWRGTKLESWADGITPANAALREISHWQERARGWALRPYPMLGKAFAWLRERAPVAPAVTIVHGDYRLGNFLEQDGRITAILDWELVHLGDPLEDLAWAMLPQYRGGSGLVSQLLPEAEFLGRWEALTGFKADPEALRTHLVLALAKLATTHIAASRCFEDGRFHDMRMPAMATQIVPVLRQVEKLLEAGR